MKGLFQVFKATLAPPGKMWNGDLLALSRVPCVSLGGIPEPSAPRGAAGDARPLGTHLLQSWQTRGKTGTKKKTEEKQFGEIICF